MFYQLYQKCWHPLIFTMLGNTEDYVLSDKSVNSKCVGKGIGQQWNENQALLCLRKKWSACSRSSQPWSMWKGAGRAFESQMPVGGKLSPQDHYIDTVSQVFGAGGRLLLRSPTEEINLFFTYTLYHTLRTLPTSLKQNWSISKTHHKLHDVSKEMSMLHSFLKLSLSNY